MRRAFSIVSALLAVCAPALLAYSVSPSATFLNQAAAVMGWGLFLFGALNVQGLHKPRGAVQPDPGCWALFFAIALLALCAVASGVVGELPSSLSLSSASMLLAALTAGVAGTAVAVAGQRLAAFQALAGGMAVAGLLSTAVGLVQVFAPEWADGRWIAVSAMEGRATGNFRQPNHLGSLLLWGLVATVALWEIKQGATRRGQKSGPLSSVSTEGREVAPTGQPQLAMPLFYCWLAATVMVTGIVLSASRTAAMGLFVLAAWGVLDRRLSLQGRAVLIASPLLYAAIWSGLTAWADLTGHAFGGATRFSMQGDISSSRFGVWANASTLIARHPWGGVGWGGFNFAWSLTPFPDRPVAFFDHTHNVVLQLAVELGVPLGALVLALAGWALWRAGLAAWRVEPGAQSVVLRGSWVMLLLVALHSQLEYPLWYAYFLLPTVFLWGLCLGGMPGQATAVAAEESSTIAASREPVGRALWSGLRFGALSMLIGGAAAVADYARVVVIFAPPVDAPPLGERIDKGERSLLFAHHAYYAAATTTPPEDAPADAFRVATHHLLDTRLMIAWAKALNAQGDVERARHLAARLREFRNPNSEAFFEPCEQAPPGQGEPLPFQCTAPTRSMDWRDFTHP